MASILNARRDLAARTCKPVDAWWTVLVIDPVAVSMLPALSRRTWVTPNRLTAVAAVLGVATCIAALTLPLFVAAVLFELRFLFDCLDGKLARFRGTNSALGGVFDLAADVTLTTAIFGCLGVRVIADSEASAELLPSYLALLPALLFLLHYWFLSWSKQLEASLPVGRRRRVTGLRGTRLARKPRSVDIEALSLFIAPLTGRPSIVLAGLLLASVYYVVAAADFLRRTTVAAKALA